MASNLPDTQTTDSATGTKQFYDKYFTKFISFPSNDVDAVIGFFQARGFSKTGAIAVGTVLLQQAKLDNIKVFELLDTLKKTDEVQLSNVVTEVLNYNREKISTLGFKVDNTSQRVEARNIEV